MTPETTIRAEPSTRSAALEPTLAPSFSARELLFGSVRTDSAAAEAGMTILRVFAGLALALAHGLGKVPPSDGFVSGVEAMGLPAPALFALLSATAEFGGGLLLALGLFTRPAALLICGNMLTAILLGHAGDPFGTREKAMLFGVIALFFLLAGAGRYSLDALVRRRS